VSPKKSRRKKISTEAVGLTGEQLTILGDSGCRLGRGGRVEKPGEPTRRPLRTRLTAKDAEESFEKEIVGWDGGDGVEDGWICPMEL